MNPEVKLCELWGLNGWGLVCSLSYAYGGTYRLMMVRRGQLLWLLQDNPGDGIYRMVKPGTSSLREDNTVRSYDWATRQEKEPPGDDFAFNTSGRFFKEAPEALLSFGFNSRMHVSPFLDGCRRRLWDS